MTVRTRVAPSPTGDPHVGTAYIALFNLAFARQHGGQFLLRIEDTDQQRSSPESEQAILDSLRWLGMEWDEGPDVGGPHGPYRQSERRDIYLDHVQQLLDKGCAFKCYRTAAELNDLRIQREAEGKNTALKASDLELPADEVARREADNAPFVVRMRVPEAGICVVNDMLRGPIELDLAQVDAQILLKSDGMPTYHLANVVDDHLMAITHVIRGEEWISSAPKHKLLYEYFGWEMPQLCHMPLLRNPDKTKLSKRKNPTSIMFYERMGFMPEALLNYLGRMGWSMPDEREQFSRDEMFANFDIKRVSLGGPVFDVDKLRWLNSLWLRGLSPEAFCEQFANWGLRAENMLPLVPHVQPRVDVFSDVVPLAGHFLSGLPALTAEQFDHKAYDDEKRLQTLQFGLWQLEAIRHWDKPEIEQRLFALAGQLDLKVRDFLFPFFIAIAGTSSTISVLDSMTLLGPDMSRARLRVAIDVLGGVGKKRLKKMEKDYFGIARAIDQVLLERAAAE
ncbi:MULTISPECIES: glutamate--tRNA ligase [unclassified Oceanobacter]|jgi:glutamyl-tRNA synthetase|uniref:glutamate--tRNA ligase n=1 Tax=unclassified Oceanobacter TaxID=2620260 RepID=UPI0026E41D71|nr:MULTISPECIES: glutamate--tRNA ligase [unclassified Oceanobacter]MDO6683288.1 glutamate--tRNA ligase [Oceanobacter sp. 5_MG-2023]MDP2504146.1 glutamate--tRNA ligase [Oceanobacter sp. 3_MG-2023]MDP2546585.1 glutamate--tRNA ligase [Oceanobacter sp. 4_MG-2023]MDP2610191.1 glutamate--tRNA ligase [Oceanobacter sp. 1_MG-2023]MDP2613457.1 glutamate--tRNA ligase [Oceanobacter sp. 2_MG-2023]